jgi:hypothetical protein
MKNGLVYFLGAMIRLKVVSVYRQLIGFGADGDEVVAAELAVRVNRLIWIGFFT